MDSRRSSKGCSNSGRRRRRRRACRGDRPTTRPRVSVPLRRCSNAPTRAIRVQRASLPSRTGCRLRHRRRRVRGPTTRSLRSSKRHRPSTARPVRSRRVRFRAPQCALDRPTSEKACRPRLSRSTLKPSRTNHAGTRSSRLARSATLVLFSSQHCILYWATPLPSDLHFERRSSTPVPFDFRFPPGSCFAFPFSTIPPSL